MNIDRLLRAKMPLVILLMWMPGCDRPNTSNSTPFTRRPPGSLSFTKDVAPIVLQHCAACHRPGQTAPFSLLTYKDVTKHAQEIVEVTRKRYMPPWPPEPGYGEFADERKLTADEIGVLQQWVDEGTVEGRLTDLPPMPDWKTGWQLGEPDLVVHMPHSFDLPANGPDIYRNFVVPLPIVGTRYVEAVEFMPGNPKIVHHAFIKVDPTQQSRRLDEQDPEPGFSFSMSADSAQSPEGHFLSWQPGKVHRRQPDMAWSLRQGTDLVLQMHLVPSGKPEDIQSRVGFYFTDRPPTNAPFKLLLTSRAIDIPPGMTNYVVDDTFILPVDVQVHAILPHAHFLAKEMRGVATLPHGEKKQLIWIKHWDFNWQGDYRYKNPVVLPKGTSISMHFVYDNSTNNARSPQNPPRRVTYGPETTDEMAELWLQVVPRSRSDLPALVKALQAKTPQIWLNQHSLTLKNNPNDADAHNGLGKALLGLGRDNEALAHFKAAIAAKADLEEPHFYLGFLLRKQRRFSEATTEYESVLRINPTNHQAHGNLGLIFLEQQNLKEAELHFRNALRINPDDAIARRNLDLVLKAKDRGTKAKP